MADKMSKTDYGMDPYIRGKNGKILASKASVARVTAIMKAKPGSELYRMAEESFAKHGVSEEESKRRRSEPGWHH